MTVLMFPGQGSQHRGMGAELFDEFPDLTSQADEILGFSIRELCINDASHQLNLTRFTQPALYTVNAMQYFNHLREGGEASSITVGHSLGEYNALLAAGAFDFETGLRLVNRRAELMGEASGGGMAAVLGKSEQQVREILAAAKIDDIDIANLNSESQIVISGPAERIQQIGAVFDQAGARYVALNVTGAFHSRYMEDARIEFAGFIDQFSFNPLSCPVVSNVTARPHNDAELKESLAAQIVSPVRWYDSVRYLLAKGETDFVQIGPGNVLTGLHRQILANHEPLDLKATPEKVKINPPEESAADPLSTLPVSRPEPSTVMGSTSFMAAYSLRYPIVAGGMQRGISSVSMVSQLAKAGMLGFFGTSGLDGSEVRAAIEDLQQTLGTGMPFGVNVVGHPMSRSFDEEVIDICLDRDVHALEAAGYVDVTPALVRFRLKGLRRGPDGEIAAPNRIIGKVSRPEAAAFFLRPSPPKIVEELLAADLISAQEAELAPSIPVASDLAVESDSAGYSDRGVAYALMPTMQRMRDNAVREYGYTFPVHIGACGGIGTPLAAACGFVMGADFLVTGSINQCTVEAGTSEQVKSMLQTINIQDTAYAPSGEFFEYGAERQVLRKGVLFPARARKLYELYRRYDSLADIPPNDREQLEQRFFKRPLAEVTAECFDASSSAEVPPANNEPKREMAAVFQWYFDQTEKRALMADDDWAVDFQIPCSQALGSFNQWFKGTDFESWRTRNVDAINIRLLNEAETYVRNWIRDFESTSSTPNPVTAKSA